MTHPSLAEMIARLHKLPAMPAVAMELLSSLSDDNTEVDALARRIAQDQAIAARVLRVANSPFYGLQTQVGSIRDAIVVLGFSSVRSLVLTATVVSGLPAGRCPGFSQEHFWRHGLAVGVAARNLARALGHKGDNLFIAGLLHDIGRLAMVVVAPDDYARVIATAHEQDCPWQQAEMSAFGYDHADVGAALAQRWNFPEDIRQALAFHHAPSGGTPGGPAGLIHYADAIAKALDLDGAEDTQLPHLDPASIDALDLDQHTLARVLAETQAGFDHCSLLLG